MVGETVAVGTNVAEEILNRSKAPMLLLWLAKVDEAANRGDRSSIQRRARAKESSNKVKRGPPMVYLFNREGVP